MEVYSYNTISCVPNVMKLEKVDVPTCEPVGRYQVDTSHFVPHCEAGTFEMRAGDVGQGLYDFPNGRDTGVAVPRSRRKSYTGDVAEASQNLKQSAKEARKAVDNSRIEFEREQILNGSADTANSNK